LAIKNTTSFLRNVRLWVLNVHCWWVRACVRVRESRCVTTKTTHKLLWRW